MRQRWLAWWADDPWRTAVLVAGLLFAGLISQGLPYWDSDFSIYFQAIHSTGLGRLFREWISPISADTRNWGFLDRAVQLIAYKLSFLIAGYDSWPYLVLRVICYAGCGAMIYAWALRLGPAERKIRWAAAAAAIFFLVAPGPIAALVWIADFAPVAECASLVLTYILWAEIEKTPHHWIGFPKLRDREQRRWLIRWIALTLAIYLGYKTKADLKLIPAVAAVFLALTRPRQWRLFLAPAALMFLLAVPWNGALFHSLPPFVPGSTGASEGFMWQPASLSRLEEFFWSSQSWSMTEGTLSLAGVLGPFLLCGAVVFTIWKRPPSESTRALIQTPRGRAHLFVLIWFLAILTGASALAAINYFFRIRYGILTLVPVAILLGSLLTWFAESWPALPQWAISGGLVLFGVQTMINLDRSVHYRRQLGQVEMAVDQAYAFVNAKYPNDPLALMPDYLPYAYRLDAASAIQHPDRLSNTADLAFDRNAGRTTVLSWQAQSSLLREVAVFSGCSPAVLFDRLMPCSPGSGVHVMRYNGPSWNPSVPRPAGTANEYLNLSYQLCTAHQPWQCIAAAKMALAILPTSAEAYNNIAAAYEDLGRWDEAIQAAREAVRLKPDFQLAKNNLAWSESQKALKQHDAHAK